MGEQLFVLAQGAEVCELKLDTSLWLDKDFLRSKVGAMKPRVTNHKNSALTRTEAVVVIAVLALLAFWFLPIFMAWYSRIPGSPASSYGMTCINNLKEISLGYEVWAGDNNGKYPMEISVANGGTMELAESGDVVKTFQLMSNELSTPKILYCPCDRQKTNAAGFDLDFTAKNISYFIGLDASSNRPQTVLAGDANLAINGVPVNSGLLQFSTKTLVTWTSSRHVPFNVHFWTPDSKRHVGNIAFAGGSINSWIYPIWQTEDETLSQAFTNSGLATNRLAIP